MTNPEMYRKTKFTSVHVTPEARDNLKEAGTHITRIMGRQATLTEMVHAAAEMIRNSPTTAAEIIERAAAAKNTEGKS